MVRVLREPCAPRTECVDVFPMLERTDIRSGKAMETVSNGTWTQRAGDRSQQQG
jgi:hypothetical protein